MDTHLELVRDSSPLAAKLGLPPKSDLKRSQESFLSVLGKKVDDTEARTPAEKAREVAEQYVSIALVQPMLKQLRETSNAAPPFAPTQAEKQFRALSDADLAQQIVKAKQFPLVDRLARDLLDRGGEMPRSVQDEIAAAQRPLSSSPALKVNP
jgi:Rod binding domain-containing protein